jgi:hypothetical protein
MRRLPLILLLVAGFAQAEVFKCAKNGQTVIQDTPCVAGSTTTKTISTGSDALGGIDWSQLKSGMTVAEVRSKFPSVKEGQRGRLATGASGLLGLGTLKIEGAVFEAELYFLNGGFARINYSTPMEQMLDNDVCLRHFEKISEAYRKKYGKESKRAVSQKSWGISAEAAWEVPGGSVYLSTSPVTGATSLLLTGFVPK